MIDWEREVVQHATRLSREEATRLEAKIRAYQRELRRDTYIALAVSAVGFGMIVFGLAALLLWPVR